MASADLPRRNPAGYRVTGIVWEITSNAQIAQRITREVPLPAPPSGNLGEMPFIALLRSLVPLAARALAILEAHEGAKAKGSYSQPQYERVEIRVMSGGRLIGRVDGAERVFDPRGNVISEGKLSHFQQTGTLTERSTGQPTTRRPTTMPRRARKPGAGDDDQKPGRQGGKEGRN